MANDDDPSGAVDNDFDDAATDPEAQLRKNIDDFPAQITPGDVVIDLVQGRPLYVRERKGTAVDVFEREAFDLITYKAHPWLPIRPTDDVFECVFLPTKPQDIPSSKGDKTYSYPRGRLARVPVEWLYDADTHRADEAAFDTLRRLAEWLPDDVAVVEAVVNAAQNGFPHDVAVAFTEMVNAEYGFDFAKPGEVRAFDDGSDE